MVEEPILKSIQASVATGLEVEESTDTAIVRPLDACSMSKNNGFAVILNYMV